MIALIVDDLKIRKWEAAALAEIADTFSFAVFNCVNTSFRRRPLRHALYYILNIVSLRSEGTRSVALPDGLNIKERIDFNSMKEGAWQRLPVRVIEQLAQLGPVCVIKFGMGLLRVPEELHCPILSYHHGDPREFRGRPAGFYEILSGVRVVGQIVQILSNELDAGAVVAFGQTRARPYSYRATMADSYRLSPLLMKAAVRNCLSGEVLPIAPMGRNFRLPSNATVLRFAAKVAWAKARRLAYGAFFEKTWEVAETEFPADSVDSLFTGMHQASRWRVLKRPPMYHFLADAFPHPEGGILVEALRRADGQGEIVHFARDQANVLCSGTGHFSYPGTITTAQGIFLVPEVAEWSIPQIYRLTRGKAEFFGLLNVDGHRRLLDPTLHAKDDRIYLFGSDIEEGSDVLRLWSAENLSSRFTEHPQSPIRISPEGSRMAGAILCLGKRLYRLGQDGTGDYGSGVISFEITQLSPTVYAESQLLRLEFGELKGPHTLNFQDGTVIFDFYRNRFSALAGLRRVRASVSKRRAMATQAKGSSFALSNRESLG